MSEAAPTPRRARRIGFRAWPGPARWASYAVVVLVLALIAAAITAVVLVRKPFPQTDGSAPLKGLSGDVSVRRDAHGIPQIYGDSVADLMRAQGYVAAQDRFFQMDVERHATSGRLAELVGPSGLPNDRLVRTLGWPRVAEQELGLVDPETRAALQAYADGVNAYLDARSPSQLGVEYTLLGFGGLDYRPVDWTPADSLTWLKAFAWDLHGNTTDEVDRALATAAVGKQRTAQLYPAYPTGVTPIVDQGAVVDGVYEQGATGQHTRDPKRPAPFGAGATAVLQRLGRALKAAPAWLGRGDGVGSNSWVVDGAHSATGQPLLADDPHLGLSLPGTWEQVGLHCRIVSSVCPLDVSGFALPGVPGVVVGHNADIAWGLTNLEADTADLFVERLSGDSALEGSSYVPMRTRTETIKVEGHADVTITVRTTKHGPLLSDITGAPYADVATASGGSDVGVAIQWTGLEPGTTADAILELDRASGWDEVRSAAASISAPALSLVYADTAGHIGYQAMGRVPIRKSGNDGRQPVPGWLPQDDWTGQDVPFDGLPTVLDPKDGFVVAANQAVAGSSYPYFLTDDWDRGYRSERIRSVIGDAGKLSVADMSALQLDTRQPFAATLVPYLLDVRLRRGYVSDGQRLLRWWDFDQGPDSAAAAYFNAVWRNLLALTFHDELPRALWPDGGQRWYAVVGTLLTEPDSTWWDDLATDGITEDRDDILRAAMLAARDELTSHLGLDVKDWSWGDLHQVSLRSPAVVGGAHATLRRLVDRDDWGVGGGPGAVDATSWDAASGYDVTTAPSMRMVVSLGDLDDSRWVNLTGASGHAFEGDYTDQTDMWADGRTLPWVWSATAVSHATEHTLTLDPSR